MKITVSKCTQEVVHLYFLNTFSRPLMPHLKAWYTIEIRLRNTFSVPFLRIFPDSKLENSLCETERERETVCIDNTTWHQKSKNKVLMMMMTLDRKRVRKERKRPHFRPEKKLIFSKRKTTCVGKCLTLIDFFTWRKFETFGGLYGSQICPPTDRGFFEKAASAALSDIEILPPPRYIKRMGGGIISLLHRLGEERNLKWVARHWSIFQKVVSFINARS